MMNDADDPAHTCGEADSPREPLSAPAPEAAIPGAAPGKILSPEAVRALQEAEARRKSAPPDEMPEEIGGRGGEEPTRFGDWERRGLAVDF